MQFSLIYRFHCNFLTGILVPFSLWYSPRKCDLRRYITKCDHQHRLESFKARAPLIRKVLTGFFAKQLRNPCSGPPPVYQDLIMHHDWAAKRAIVILPIRLKGNSKRISGNSSSIIAASQTLLTGVKLRLLSRLVYKLDLELYLEKDRWHWKNPIMSWEYKKERINIGMYH